MNPKVLAALQQTIVPMEKLHPKLKTLLYGVSGVGKTVEAMELAHMVTPPKKRILYIDTGEGFVSLKNHPGLIKPNVVRMAYHSALAQVDSVVDAIKEGVSGFDDFATIVFDEFSTVAKKDMHTIVTVTLGNDDMAAPEFKQYNIATRRMERVAFKLLELKESHNLILIAHSRTDADKVTEIPLTGPSFMSKFGETLKGEMHVVARMTANVENKTGAPVYKREMQVHPTKMVVAKSRIGGLDILVSPERFNARLVEWLNSGASEVDEKEVVELNNEVPVNGDFSDQTEFAGFEVGE